jgi:hypothetical protein
MVGGGSHQIPWQGHRPAHQPGSGVLHRGRHGCGLSALGMAIRTHWPAISETGRQSRRRILKGQMKKPSMKPTEHECPACNGTGFPVVMQPVQPGRKIYPVQCMNCAGKGRISEAAN